ncbi:hypothetical protein JX266_012507 [Neoarthrinium moseri]|nr:hypothetical protein JX266_012507 [Neoarthrinium moseri]
MFAPSKLFAVAAGLSVVRAQVGIYGQCGGSGYTGSTQCVSGAVCSSYNPYYYQCIPGVTTGSSTNEATSTSTRVTSATSKTLVASSTSAILIETSTPQSSGAASSKPSSSASAQVSSSAIKYLMVFGDSYSTTGSWIGGDKPSARNPIGNPTLPGTTTSGGLNWVGHVTSKLNTSLVLAYDLAVSGAVTDSSIVDGYASYNFDGQVDLFQSYLSSKPDYAPWTSANTLVAVWIGINDVGESFWDFAATPINAVMDRYFDLLLTLYDDGATNFVLFSVPPFDRAPVMVGQSADRLNALRSNITAYNSALSSRLATFKAAHKGITAQLFDSSQAFETVLNSPTKYGASSDVTCYNSDGTTCVW